MTQDNEDVMLDKITQNAADLAAYALRSYYKSARQMIVEGGHDKAEAVWLNPVWWTQIMALVMLEESRRNSGENGKLAPVLLTNIRMMLDAVERGEALFDVLNTSSGTRQ